jgi:sugar phosphate isomerase/epimerase
LISVAQYQEDLLAGRRSVLDVIEAAQRLGANGAELRRETWPRRGRELKGARALLTHYGLLVTYATMATLFGSDDATLRDDIGTARALGSPLLRLFPGPIPDDDDHQAWETAHSRIGYATSRGVTIALENYSGSPGGRVGEIRHVLDRCESRALATNIDIGNYARHNEDVPAAIRAVGQRAISAHLKDQTRSPADPPTYLGGGSLPLGAILDELDRLPQRILLCFEFPGGGAPEDRIRQSLAYLRQREERHPSSTVSEVG